jgi:hypothetical protein
MRLINKVPGSFYTGALLAVLPEAEMSGVFPTFCFA